MFNNGFKLTLAYTVLQTNKINTNISAINDQYKLYHISWLIIMIAIF